MKAAILLADFDIDVLLASSLPFFPSIWIMLYFVLFLSESGSIWRDFLLRFNRIKWLQKKWDNKTTWILMRMLSFGTRTNYKASKWISMVQVVDTTELIGRPKRTCWRLWNRMMPYNLIKIILMNNKTNKLKVINRTLIKIITILVKNSYESSLNQFIKTM